MANTVILTLLPNGFAADGRLRLSVVAGFQLDPVLAKFEASPIADWPRRSNELELGALRARGPTCRSPSPAWPQRRRVRRCGMPSSAAMRPSARRRPRLARRLGLIIDVLAPLPSPGIVDGGLIRLDIAPEAPVRRVFDRVRLLPSRIRLDRSKRLFVMATRPGPRSEVVDGMLDLSPVETKYELGDIDVHGLTRQLGALARRLDADRGPVTLPLRRDGGLTLAQAGRAAVVEAAIDAANFRSGPPEAIEGEPVLYADDVTGGYRIDVSRNGGPFRSLMRRQVVYRIGDIVAKSPTLAAADEGMVEGLVAVEQAAGARR